MTILTWPPYLNRWYHSFNAYDPGWLKNLSVRNEITPECIFKSNERAVPAERLDYVYRRIYLCVYIASYDKWRLRISIHFLSFLLFLHCLYPPIWLPIYGVGRMCCANLPTLKISIQNPHYCNLLNSILLVLSCAYNFLTVMQKFLSLKFVWRKETSKKMAFLFSDKTMISPLKINVYRF